MYTLVPVVLTDLSRGVEDELLPFSSFQVCDREMMALLPSAAQASQLIHTGVKFSRPTE